MKWTWVVLLTGAGCAGAGFPDVVDSREVSTPFGAPRLSRVRDLGSVRLPETGAWIGAGDGVAVPGELLLLEGSNLGRQPRVTIGGRATGILARTDGGGLVVRVPTGVPVGPAVEVQVAHAKGKATRSVPVRRFAVVVHEGKLWVLEVDREGAKLTGAPLSIPGARLLRLSPDGAAAYLIASSATEDRLVVVDLTAPGGPRRGGERRLTHHARLLAVAADAPLAVVAGDGKVTVLDCKRALEPAAYEPVPMPKEMGSLRVIALSPDGKLLVGLPTEGNRLVVADLETTPALKFVTSLDLLPTERLPVVRDLSFSSDGETLWVLSGGNSETLPAVVPTRLTALRLMLEGAPPSAVHRVLSVWRTQSVPGATAPLHVAAARGQPLASGTTIRLPPEKAAVFATTVADALFKLGELHLATPGGAEAALKLWRPPPPGMMVRADVSGGGGPLFTTREILSALDLTPDAQLVVATAARPSPAPATGSLVLDFGVTIATIWGNPQPVFLPLGPLAPAELKPPFEFGAVQIQP